MTLERFDTYMDRCLYGGSGFYVSGAGRAGRRTGDFITSPEVGPLFGAVLARWLDTQWDELGRPDPFVVVDAGTGPGTLLRTLERAQPACAAVWELIGVDPANGVALPAHLDGAVVIANELLDNLIVRIVVRDSAGWHEVWVDEGVEKLLPLSDDEVVRLPGSLADLPVGSRAPWFEAAAEWIEEIRRRGASRFLAFDYGSAATADLVDRGGWLRTYRQHQRGSDPYVTPGSADITVDVGFDQLPPGAELTRQADFLVEHGLDALVDEGRRHWAAHAARPDLEAMVMRSRVTEGAALTDPDGLGSWIAATWRW